MKEVMAVVRINKMNETKKALADAGFPSLTATGRVLGRGKGIVDFRIIQGAADGHEEAISKLSESPQLVPKRLVTLIVHDDKVDLAVKTLIKVNQSGNSGDGKIFILPIEDSYRVRTGERGTVTLD
ncbi:MAG: P-II family nitrogen regulator [Spirochaetaceae bacterium]|nr:P-II family nitrogen regulator [Spirochaetaceae bacterium]